MSEDDPKPEASAASAASSPALEMGEATAVEAEAEASAADRANPLTTESTPAAPKPATPGEPINKLHEWGAAILIMLLLSGILFGFFSLFRGARI